MQQVLSSQKFDRPVDVLIKLDHASIFDLYAQYLKTTKKEEKKAMGNELIRQICVHSNCEKNVYEQLDKYEGQERGDELRSVHQAIEELLSQLDATDVANPLYDTMLEKVMGHLRPHTVEEEELDLPKLRAIVGEEGMIQLGSKFNGARTSVPTRPHPGAPKKPNLLTKTADLMTAPLDKTRDLGRDFTAERVPEE